MDVAAIGKSDAGGRESNERREASGFSNMAEWDERWLVIIRAPCFKNIRDRGTDS